MPRIRGIGLRYSARRPGYRRYPCLLSGYYTRRNSDCVSDRGDSAQYGRLIRILIRSTRTHKIRPVDPGPFRRRRKLRAPGAPKRRRPPTRNAALDVEPRVKDLQARMTPQEKTETPSGSGWMESQPNPNARLGNPAIKMADGPLGVRNWRGSSSVANGASTVPMTATAFPAGIAWLQVGISDWWRGTARARRK